MPDNTFATPAWWKPLKANTYQGAANALIPYLSQEDQRSVGTYLGEKAPTLKSYANAPYAPAIPKITPGVAQNYLSSSRAAQAMQGLQKAGVTSGAGFNYLSSILNTIQRLGGNGGAITRANYQELVTAINAIDTAAKANSGLQPWMTLGRQLVSPTFSAGPLTNQVQTQSGRTIYGNPNTSLFG